MSGLVNGEHSQRSRKAVVLRLETGITGLNVRLGRDVDICPAKLSPTNFKNYMAQALQVCDVSISIPAKKVPGEADLIER